MFIAMIALYSYPPIFELKYGLKSRSSIFWYIATLCWQDDHVEATEELPKKAKLFFAHAVDKWDAEFCVKVNDDVYVNIG